MNVAALKRVDPYIKDILETATHVALYTFNAVNNEWEKTDIEGALFVYSRNGEPYNSVLIMNRLNTNNLVEPVTQGLDLQLQEPFLLYRNSRCNIYGIWFYNREECLRIGAMLNELIKDLGENCKPNSMPVVNKNKNSGPSPSSMDIISMLKKAQKDFNTNRTTSSCGDGSGGEGVGSKSPLVTQTSENITGPLAAPLGPDVTSQSVMDFFAKAKVNTGHFKPGDQPTPGGAVVNETKPLLERLMSHPAAHTLEHIEKQQRSITPQPAVHQQSELFPSRLKKRSKTTVPQDSIMSTPGSITQQELQPATNQTANDTNSIAEFLRIQSPINAASPNLTNHQTSSDIIGSASDDIINASMLSPTSTGTALPLIPPVMFAVPSSRPLQRPYDPLTRQQFYQAFTHLVRTDPDFVTKLHEAYVKSFSETLP